jgi:hypothetical protein
MAEQIKGAGTRWSATPLPRPKTIEDGKAQQRKEEFCAQARAQAQQSNPPQPRDAMEAPQLRLQEAAVAPSPRVHWNRCYADTYSCVRLDSSHLNTFMRHLISQDRSRQNLRLEPTLWGQTNHSRGKRPGNISGDTWITEAISEKLTREQWRDPNDEAA